MGFLRETLGLGRHDPLEGTNATIWSSGFGAYPSIADFWTQTFGFMGSVMSPSTAEKVWVANRCIQLNSQQIAGMPLRFHGTFEPIWTSDPDPTWYPNGISDALFAAVRSIYGWGFALLFITSRYATGYPAGWTVIDPAAVTIEFVEGRRRYKVNDDILNPFDVVQIDRDPGFAVHGTPAIAAYASQAWGLLAGSDLSRSVLQGGVPLYGLQSKRRINETQSEAIQARWVERTSARGGAPPVLPPELAPVQLGLSPSELLLLDGLGFNARVIASAYGVPPFLLNLPLEGGLTYQNPEKLGEFWWRFELRPTAKRIADAFSKQLLPRGNWVVFDASDTFAPISVENTPGSGDPSEEDDPQLAGVEPAATAAASPAAANGNRATEGVAA
jgi:HK97 family phage portal protein